MFEDYLEDAHFFCAEAEKLVDGRESARFYRASVFYTASAMEAFVNYIGDTFAQADVFEPYEIAFLTDREFKRERGEFRVSERLQPNRIEDKLKYLMYRFSRGIDLGQYAPWCKYTEFREFRNSIVHPRQDADEIDITQYRAMARIGLSSTIAIMDVLCSNIFDRPLRKRLIDLGS